MSPAVLAAIAAGLAILVGAASLMGVLSPERRRLIARADALERGTAAEGLGPLRGPVLRDQSLSGSNRANALLSRFDWTSRTAAMLERADLPLKVGEYLLILVSAAVAAGVVAMLMSDLWLVGLGFGIAALLTVRAWVGNRARRRLSNFNKQLPTALSLMSTSLRSGFSIMETTRTVAREMDPPISVEFGRLLDEARVGGSFEDSVNRMMERVDSADLRIVARALDIHRRVGGDLAAILESVARTMREREELRGHVQALTAQQRFGGMIVGLLPIWVVGFMSVTSPEFISPLWEETLGRVFMAIGIAMELVAFVVIRQILKVEV